MKIRLRANSKHALPIVLFVVAIVSTMSGQTERDLLDLNQPSTPQQERNLSSPSLSITQLKGAPLESTIDPAAYFVGPSDQFAVNIWLATPMNFILTVTPEGTLIVPTVGEVRVADMTLAQAKERVIAEIKKKYVGGGPTVTLMTPRPLIVMVTGQVLHPGSFVLAGYNRVDRAIEEAMRPVREQIPLPAEPPFKEGSRRNIRVAHKDGTVSRVDIPRFLSTREDRWNPYLREGDAVVVPRYDPLKNVVAVYGEVNVPSQFEYVDGDSVKDLLRIAYGFTPSAKVDSVELVRMDLNGNLTENFFFDGKALLEGKVADMKVMPGDRVVVRPRADYRADYHVTIKGEVNYPGKYPISKNGTRLSDIIAQAGGVTQFASLHNAELVRNAVDHKDLLIERLQSVHGGVPPEDTAYYNLESNFRIQRELVNIDFERLIEHKDSTADIVLRDFDDIIIPSKSKTVYVFGQVVSPGHVPLVPGENLRFYIRRAGGVTDRAREGDIKIIKAKNKQWLSPGETTIEDGDYIWVPKEVERNLLYYTTIISQAASVIGVAATVALLFVQINK